jgi:hypothetical protein
MARGGVTDRGYVSKDDRARPKRRMLKQSGWSGIAQLTLVEHCLCPLHPPNSGFVHEAGYLYFPDGRRRVGRCQVTCPLKLKPDDEFYLWGLLALTFAQPQPEPDFYASARFCLRHLGLTQGGKSVKLLREAIHRLGAVSYRNKTFYDPVRKEHRDVGFGFLSYDVPTRNESLRPWRIAWDGVFFELCREAGGHLGFDLPAYRQLRPASRRLFLFLRKILHRKNASPVLDVRHLAVNVLGFAPGLRATDHNKKVYACAVDVAGLGLVTLPPGGMQALCKKVPGRRGVFCVQFCRGPFFMAKSAVSFEVAGETRPLFDLLERIGFGKHAAKRLLKTYDVKLLTLWADITLARAEQGLPFTKSRQAFFMHNVKAAANGRRTPPDWYQDLKKEEKRKQWAAAGRKLGLLANVTPESPTERDARFREYLAGEGLAEYVRITEEVFCGDQKAAKDYLRRRFERQQSATGMQRVGELLRVG